MQLKNIVLGCVFAFPLFAGDVMVERMQSVVNEVSELRERYEEAKSENETCESQLQELSAGGSVSKSTKADTKRIQDLESENEKLKEVHAAAKKEAKRLKELESEMDVLEKEKNRLNASAQILVEKNHSLLEQLNRLKRSADEPSDTKLLIAVQEKETIQKKLELSQRKLLEVQERNAKLQSTTASSVLAPNTFGKENKTLHLALKKCQNTKVKTRIKVKNSKGICVDDNPFPKLLQKETLPQSKPKVKEASSPKAISKTSSGVYRIKGESQIYNAIDGKVIEIWEDTRSFTSNVSEATWVKITGYFVDKKWRKASSTMWVKKENTIRR